MERLVAIAVLFVAAGLCEIGGGYLVWGWMREHKPLAWALLGGTPGSPGKAKAAGSMSLVEFEEARPEAARDGKGKRARDVRGVG